MTPTELKLAGDLLLIAADRMHELDDVPFAALVPSEEERARMMAEMDGPAPVRSSFHYAPAKRLMAWMGHRLHQEAA